MGEGKLFILLIVLTFFSYCYVEIKQILRFQFVRVLVTFINK